MPDGPRSPVTWVDQRSDDERPARRWQVAAAAAAIATGAWLRLRQLSSMEFKTDEQGALALAKQLVDDRLWASPGTWPTHGMLSSVGIANPPLFSWLVAAPWAVWRDPVQVATCVAAVNALCLVFLWRWAARRLEPGRALLVLMVCAFSPFAVTFSRKVWTQDLLLPGLIAVLWCVEYWREGRTWRALGLLLAAGLLVGQLHLSGPIALGLLPLALLAQGLEDHRQGRQVCRPRRPTGAELVLLLALVALNLFFWLPYVNYVVFEMPRGILGIRPRADHVGLDLLWHVRDQVIPVGLFHFFEPHRNDFLANPLNAVAYRASVALGAPLFVYGVWRWLRTPFAVPVIGVWWMAVVTAFALARVVTYPFYALVLAPFPAVLAAGGFDPPRLPAPVGRLLTAWRVAYAIALLCLTFAMQSWLVARGGAAGDYGVAYRIRQAQADALVQRAGPAARGSSAGPREGPDEGPGPAAACVSIPLEVVWLASLRTPAANEAASSAQLCETWSPPDAPPGYRWALRAR